jgi:hypothetical protein
MICQLYKFNNLEFKMQNLLLDYKKFIYIQWRFILLNVKDWVGGWEEVGTRHVRGTCQPMTNSDFISTK